MYCDGTELVNNLSCYLAMVTHIKSISSSIFNKSLSTCFKRIHNLRYFIILNNIIIQYKNKLFFKYY